VPESGRAAPRGTTNLKLEWLGRCFQLDIEAELTEAPHQSLGGLEPVDAVEMVGPEVLIGDAVFEHEVDRRKGGGRDCEHGLLGSTPSADAIKLRAQVRVLGTCGGPSTLHQECFEPRRALAHAIGALLARALVAARTVAHRLLQHRRVAQRLFRSLHIAVATLRLRF